MLQDHARLTLVVELAGPHGDQLAHTVRRELIGENTVRGEALAEEPRRGPLPARPAARHHHDGVGLGHRVFPHESPADQAEYRAVADHDEGDHHERCDGQAARACDHRSSSTRYSLIRRESGALGLRARYFWKASLAFSGCLLW